MNREEILAMEAGRELDALVIQKVMGATPVTIFRPPPYSTDIPAAFQVVEKLGGGRDIVQIAVVYHLHFGEWTYRVTISFQEISKANVIVWSKTAPEAICKSALIAKLEVKK